MFFFFNSLLKSWPCVSFLDKFSVAICLHELKKKKKIFRFFASSCSSFIFKSLCT